MGGGDGDITMVDPNIAQDPAFPDQQTMATVAATTVAVKPDLGNSGGSQDPPPKKKSSKVGKKKKITFVAKITETDENGNPSEIDVSHQSWPLLKSKYNTVLAETKILKREFKEENRRRQYIEQERNMYGEELVVVSY